MSATRSNPYDALPYAGQAFPQTHPARLAAMARLFGLQAPDVATCRVLELGCASGDNLVPLAVAMPHARFIGIDLSARQIDAGRRTIAATGLSNIELAQRDMADFGAADATFDFIIAHGVYSWVPAAIRDRLFAICRDNLAPNGVAYVSYKTLPGWSTHETLRELMLRHAPQDDPLERMRGARAVLALLGEHSRADTPAGALMREQVESLREVPDTYLFHDHLEEVSHPVYFHRFVAEAAAHDLQYLSEASLGGSGPGQVTAQAAAAVQALTRDFVELEQFVDVLVHRSFRQSLLVHAGVRLERRVPPESLASFAIASPARPASRTVSVASGVPEVFEAPNALPYTTSTALTKSALHRLFDRWPGGVPFAELHALARAGLGLPAAPGASALADEQRVLGEELLRAYAAGVVDLRLWSPPVAALPGQRPLASPLARHQATLGGPATNLLHMRVNLDPYSRALLPLLDGTRDFDALLAAMRSGAATASGAHPAATQPLDPADNLRRNLMRLAKAGLLVG